MRESRPINFDGCRAGVRTPSIGAVQLTFKDRQAGRQYVSRSVRLYGQLIGPGLRPGSPLDFIIQQGRLAPADLMADRGMMFWDDYGGRSRFGDLRDYLDRLVSRIAIRGVKDTSLAWAPAYELRKLVA